jgi:hypothetical protein
MFPLEILIRRNSMLVYAMPYANYCASTAQLPLVEVTSKRSRFPLQTKNLDPSAKTQEKFNWRLVISICKYI